MVAGGEEAGDRVVFALGRKGRAAIGAGRACRHPLSPPPVEIFDQFNNAKSIVVATSDISARPRSAASGILRSAGSAGSGIRRQRDLRSAGSAARGNAGDAGDADCAGPWQARGMRPLRQTRYARAHDMDSWKTDPRIAARAVRPADQLRPVGRRGRPAVGRGRRRGRGRVRGQPGGWRANAQAHPPGLDRAPTVTLMDVQGHTAEGFEPVRQCFAEIRRGAGRHRRGVCGVARRPVGG